MVDVLISESVPGAHVEALCSRFEVSRQPKLWKDQQALQDQIRSARTLMVRNNTLVTAEVLRAAKHLIAVGRVGAGLDNIDMEAARQAGIVVTYAPDQNSISAAELTIGLMIGLARRIPAASIDTKNGGWNRHQYVGTELYGKTLGIIGAGKIGYLTAARARALGMDILAYDPFLHNRNVFLTELRAELVELNDLLSRADVISCHVPASPSTEGLIDRQRLQQMRPTAYFINTSRGSVVVEEDLIAALKAGALAGAALDVRRAEPPARGELEEMPNVILTPHIAAFTQEAQDRVTRVVCEDLARLLGGKPALNAATPYRLPHNGGSNSLKG